jgi:hypothetical protein
MNEQHEPAAVDERPWEPPLFGTESEHLLGALDRLRATFRWKVDGLDATGLDTRVGATTMTLGGLLKHLAVQEDYSSAVKLDGEEMPPVWDVNGWDDDDDWEFSSAAKDTPEQLYTAYDDAVERSRARFRAAIVAHGMEQKVAMGRRVGEDIGVRRLLCDLLEEYGRHTGHADLIREGVDGRTGEDPPPGWPVPWLDAG